MTEFFKLVLAQIPAYLSDFVNVLGHPRRFAKENIAFGKGSDSKALLFLGISILLSLILKSPILGEISTTPLFLARDAFWKAFLIFAMAGPIWLSWRAVGGHAQYKEYAIANCYYFSVFSVLSHVFLVIEFGPLSGVAHSPFEIEILDWVVYVTIGSLVLWAVYCWQVYGDLNGASSGRRFGAFVFVCLIGLPVLALVYALRFVLEGNKFTSHGY